VGARRKGRDLAFLLRWPAETEATAAAQAVEADRRRELFRENKQIAKAREPWSRSAKAQLEGCAHRAAGQVTDAPRQVGDSAAGHLEQARADLSTAQTQPQLYEDFSPPVSGRDRTQ